MKAISILTFASLALSPMLAAESVAITPLNEQKGLEANGETIEAIIRNEKARNTLQKLNAPIFIRSMEEAAKHLTRASMEKIEVDFNTHKVVVFAWQGSGQDKLEGFLIQPGRETMFEYHRGRTRDLRTHSAVYAIPKDKVVLVLDPHAKQKGKLGPHPLPAPPKIPKPPKQQAE